MLFVGMFAPLLYTEGKRELEQVFQILRSKKGRIYLKGSN